MGRDEILGYLRSGQWVSGEEMAAALHITRSAVWKQMESLRKKGYQIEASTRKGYRLTGSDDLLDADLIRAGLETKLLGRELLSFQEVTSTNEVARSLAYDCPDGTVVLAEIQIHGRGRLSRPWASPPGGVWMSLVLKPEIPMAGAYALNMAAAVGIARAISGLYDLRVGIKWPNDLLVGERKICGILMEVSAEVDRLEYAVIGIGINANVDVSSFPDEWHSTSLSQELGRPVSRVELIQRVLLEIEAAYEKLARREIYEEWRSRSITLGRRVRIVSSSGDLEGVAVDLAEDGALCLETGTGERRILAGDCIHLRALGET